MDIFVIEIKDADNVHMELPTLKNGKHIVFLI